MKRFFFSLIALSAVAAGCTQSALLETPDFGGTEISFEPYTGRTPVTKASAILNPADLASNGGFNVVGYLTKTTGTRTTTSVYMPAVHFTGTTSGTTTTWTPESTYYWPDRSSGSTLSFVAYSANASSLTWVNPDTKEAFTYTVPEQVNDQVDLLATSYYADLTVDDTSNGQGQVPLHFYHLLSKVGFKVLTTGNSERGVTITGLSVSGKMYSQGKLELKQAKSDAATSDDILGETSANKPKLILAGSKTSQTYMFLDKSSASDDFTPVNPSEGDGKRIERKNSLDQASEFLMIMPQTVVQGDDITIEVNYTIGDNENPKTSIVVIPEGFTFSAGKQYEFILKISTSALTFSVQETDWGETTSSPTIEPQPEPAITLNSAVTTDSGADFSLIVNSSTNLTEVGVEYKSVDEEEWIPGPTKNTGFTEDTPFILSIENGLDQNTEYLYRAYAIVAGTTTYYPAQSPYPSFITKVDVTLDEPTNPSAFGATLSASFDGSGITIIDFGFCWVEGDSTTPTIENRKESCFNKTTFSYTINVCKPATTYRCRAYVINEKNVVSYSEVKTFTTKFGVDTADQASEQITGNEAGEIDL